MIKQIILLFFLSPLLLNSQIIEGLKIYKDNEITSYNNQKLILVDFWATWCAPCIPAGKQLEILQGQSQDLIYMMAISEELDSRITPYLERRQKKLMILSDYEGITFQKYSIASLPYAIIFNQTGAIVWRGRSSDVTLNLIKTLHKKYSHIQSKPLDFHLKMNRIENPIIQNKMDSKPFFKLNRATSSENIIANFDNNFRFTGFLSELIKEFYFLSDFEVEVTADLDLRVDFEVNDVNFFRKNNSLFDIIYDTLGYTIIEKETTKTVHLLQLDTASKLWKSDASSSDVSQGVYILSDDRIEAYHSPISLVAKLLSEVTGENYYYDGTIKGLYDWNFQYKYEALMAEELQDQFGIVVKKNQKAAIRLFQISKKQ